MKQLEDFISGELELNERFREADSFYWGFREAMEKVLKYLNEEQEKDVEEHRKRWNARTRRTLSNGM